MNTQDYQTRREGGFLWTFRAECEDLLCVDFGRTDLEGRDENRVRIRGRYETRGDTYFIKVFKKARLGRVIKTVLLGHTALREFYASRFLSGGGIRTPEAVAVGVSSFPDYRAVIIFREVPDAVPMRDLVLSARPEERHQYLSLVAETTAELHRASFHHRDYHGGNLLFVGEADGRPLLWVIDLHRSSFPRDMAGAKGLDNIADVLHSFMPALDREDIGRFVSRYRRCNPAARWDDTRAEKVIEKRIGRIEARRLRSRVRRCMVESSGFFVKKDRGTVVYGRRGSATDTAMALVDDFGGANARIIKSDKKATIALVSAGPGDVCIKAYHLSGPFDRIRALFGRSRGHASWRAAEGLSLRGFRVPVHLCLVVKRDFLIPRAVFLVTQSIAPGLEMDRFITRRLSGNDAGTIVRFATDLGATIGSLHRAGVYHRDLKAVNIAVEENGTGYSFSFMDLDAVSFGGRVSVTRRAKNLAQLFLSTPLLVDAEARRAFFDEYVSASGGASRRESVSDLVGRLVQGQDILYVSDRGDVVEDARELYHRLWGGC